jgi:hypothetical protein
VTGVQVVACLSLHTWLQKKTLIETSAVDPDPDPAFQVNPDPDSGFCWPTIEENNTAENFLSVFDFKKITYF